VIRIVTKIELIGPLAMPYRYKKFRQNSFTTFSVILRTDRQTDKQTDRSENITSSCRGNNKHAVVGRNSRRMPGLSIITHHVGSAENVCDRSVVEPTGRQFPRIVGITTGCGPMMTSPCTCAARAGNTRMVFPRAAATVK